MSNELENNIIPIELNGACPKEDRREETAGNHNPPEGIILPPSQEAELNPLQDVASNQPASNSQNEGAAPQETAPNLLIMPNPQDINLYLDVVFNYCKGWIPIRAFGEGEAHLKNFIHNRWIKVDREAFTNCLPMADLAAINNTAFYMIPGTVEKPGQARAAHIINMQTVLIDIDTGNIAAKLAHLRHYLGKPTLIVESSGITAEGQNKLHAYWQLTEAYEGDDLKKIAKAREIIARKAGGDLHFKSLHQPIRVPGSVYLKHGAKRLVRIIEHNDLEYDLAELLEFSEDMPLLAGEEARYVNWGGKTNGDGRSATDVKNGFDIKNVLDFNGLYRPPIESVMTTKVYEGGVDGVTRFESQSRVIGYWLRRVHQGVCPFEEAWEEIQGYNEACVRAPWTIERLQTETKALWNKHVKENGEPKVIQPAQQQQALEYLEKRTYSFATIAADTQPTPDDLIGPRILPPGEVLVLGGAPKAGKSDFLMHLLVHMAAGQSFLSFKASRPLRVFYMQMEVGYHYLKERIQSSILKDKQFAAAGQNLILTERLRLILRPDAVNQIIKLIEQRFPDPPDIIAFDPLRNLFDGGADGKASENDNTAMMLFLNDRIEKIQQAVNPKAGIIIAHHTRKLGMQDLKEAPFEAFAGASSLRGFYSSGMILCRSEEDKGKRILFTELRNGPDIGTLHLRRTADSWLLEDVESERLAMKEQGRKLDLERHRKQDAILKIIRKEALKRKTYTTRSFTERFEGASDLGGRDAIAKRLNVLISKGYILKQVENWVLEYVQDFVILGLEKSCFFEEKQWLFLIRGSKKRMRSSGQVMLMFSKGKQSIT